MPTAEQFLQIQASPEFQELRTKLRRFVFPMSAFFLLWYAVYVLVGALAHDFMAIRVWGDINVGLLIGLGQFVTTFVITGIYVRFANRELDPRAEAIRAEQGLEAAPGPFIIPSARPHKNMGYDLYRVSGSVGYGLTDNWEVTASLPMDRISGHGGDRNGFINGFY